MGIILFFFIFFLFFFIFATHNIINENTWIKFNVDFRPGGLFNSPKKMTGVLVVPFRVQFVN